VAKSRRFDDQPETDEDRRFFDLRESGYTGWIDRHGYAVPCPACGNPKCTAGLTGPCNS